MGEGIDGLIHLSDLSWDQAGEEAVHDYKKGQEVEAVILATDSERERISLGIKQMTENHFASYLDAHPKGSIVKAVVTVVNDTHAMVDLGDEVNGQIKASEVAEEKVTDIHEFLRSGDEIEAKIVGIDKKSGMINLSIKAKDHQDQREALHELKQSSTANTTLGDLFKEKMDNRD